MQIFEFSVEVLRVDMSVVIVCEMFHGSVSLLCQDTKSSFLPLYVETGPRVISKHDLDALLEISYFC